MHVKKILGFVVLGALLAFAVPVQQAQAATPVSPGITATAQGDAGKLTTDVQWGNHHNHHWRPRHHHHHQHWRPHRHHHHHGHRHHGHRHHGHHRHNHHRH